MDQSNAETNPGDETRYTQLGGSEETGAQLGVCIYLSPAQLSRLGINVQQASRIAYQVASEDNRIVVEEATEDSSS